MEQISEQQRTAATQYLTTEHTALQTARSGTIFDANGRAGLFLNAVSSAVVALAFIGQVGGIGDLFYLFGLVVCLTLLFLGVATFHRTLQSGIEDVYYARAINRIRQYYVEQTPQIRAYLLLSTRDDTLGIMANMGISGSPWQMFLTTAGTVGVISSVLAGCSIGFVLVWLTPLQAGFSIGASLLGVLLGLLVSYRFQSRAWERAEQMLPHRDDGVTADQVAR